jgi:hypothetical protein
MDSTGYFNAIQANDGVYRVGHCLHEVKGKGLTHRVEIADEENRIRGRERGIGIINVNDNADVTHGLRQKHFNQIIYHSD